MPLVPVRTDALGTRRLTIAQMLTWVAACALGIAWYQDLSGSSTVQRRLAAFQKAYNLTMGIAAGTFLAGGYLLASRRRRGEPPVALEPGHALLKLGVAAACAELMSVGGAVEAARMAGVEADFSWTLFRIARAPEYSGLVQQVIGWGSGGAVALGLASTWRRALPLHWLGVVLTLGVFALTLAAVLGDGLVRGFFLNRPAIGFLRCSQVERLYFDLLLVGGATLLAAVGRDAWLDVWHDGLHWAGVAAWLAIFAVQLATCFIL